METSTYKTSTILVSIGPRTQVFHSVDEIPIGLRKKLHANLAGPNARTLIVADRRGREYLSQALRVSAVEAEEKPSRRFASLETLAQRWSDLKTYWLEIGLIGLLGLASWTLFRWT